MSMEWLNDVPRRDTGLPWLSKVPAHWEVVPLKRMCNGIKTGSTPKDLENISLDEATPTVDWFTPGDFSATIELTNSNRRLPAALLAENELTWFPASSVLVVSIGATLGKVGLLTESASANQQINALLPSPEVEPKFLAYQLQAQQEALMIHANLATLPILNQQRMGEIKMVFPPLAEQTAIVAYIEAETTRLDQLVAAKREQLELISEKRRALITHAVTQGLNDAAPRRETGLPWLGQVPVGWEVVRLRFLAEVHTGITKGRQVQGKNAIMVPYLRVANVQAGYLDLTEVEEIEIFAHELSGYALQPGDVLMNEGGDADKLGRGTVWEGQISPCIHQNHVFAVRCFGVSPAWLATVSNADSARFYFESRSKQSTNLASISSANIKEFPVVLPPAAEQAAILAYIEAETARLDTLRENTERSLELLHERRASLIAAAVTGELELITV